MTAGKPKEWKGERSAELIRRGRLGERFSDIATSMGCSFGAAQTAWSTYASEEDRAVREHSKAAGSGVRIGGRAVATVWVSDRRKEMVRQAREGRKWREIAADLGVGYAACYAAWIKYATKEDRAARSNAFAGAYDNCGPAKPVPVVAAPVEITLEFAGKPFAAHNVTTRDYGRAPMPDYVRYSLTPGWR